MNDTMLSIFAYLVGIIISLLIFYYLIKGAVKWAIIEARGIKSYSEMNELEKLEYDFKKQKISYTEYDKKKDRLIKQSNE